MKRPVFNDLPALSYWSDQKITDELLRAALRDAATRYAKGRLVDLGCGAKPYEPYFAPKVESYFGVDFGDTAELHYGVATRADLFVDGADTKLPSASFDTLLSTQVLEHVFETDRFVAECHRLLAKGGVGIFTIPFVWQCHAEPNDFFRFTRYSLEKLFVKHGFRILELRPLGGAYATIMQTRIISLHCRELRNLPYRLLRKVRNFVMLPIWNWMGLHLDRLFWNDKLCLNYLLVVAKP